MEMQATQSLNQQLNDNQQLLVNPDDLLDITGGNVRRQRSKKDKDELTTSIQSNGIIQPVVARPHPHLPKKLELLAGYGRRDIASELGLNVPVLIRLVDDRKAMEIHLAENLVRSDLSLIDEVYAAKRYLSFHNGDRKTAATCLGWKLSKLNERLELLKASEKIILALEEGKITATHATILSAFSQKIQNNTLDKVIAEKWTVSTLRARARNFHFPLAKAKFDTHECNTCPHNTQSQAGLFDIGDEPANCANPVCFQSKTKEHLQEVKVLAEERHGKVLWLSQSMPQDRNTVSPSTVGNNQFRDGCMACSNRVAVLDDSIDSAGALIESQCIDSNCFNRCIESQQINEAKDKCTTSTTSTKSDKKAGSTQKKAKPDIESASASNVVIERHQAELKNAASAQLKDNNTYGLALQIVSLAHMVGHKTKEDVKTTIANLLQKPEKELNSMISDLVSYSKEKTTHFNNEPAYAVLSKAACVSSSGKQALISSWIPSKDTLSKCTTALIVQICMKSGFESHFDTANGKGAFKKIASGRKDPLVTLIIDNPHNFDWTEYAPPAYLKLISDY